MTALILAITAPCGAGRTVVPARTREGRGDDLLRRAALVASTRDWFGRRFNIGLRPHWIDENHVIHTRFRAGDRGNRTAYRLDVRTGKDIPLPHLTKALDAFPVEVVDDEQLSPDGKWLLRSERWGDCLLAEVNGPKRYVYSTGDGDGYRSFVWFSDSRRWVEHLGANGRTFQMIVHDLRIPNASRRLPVVSRSAHFASIKRILSYDRAIALVEPERDPDRANPDSSVTLYELSLDAAKKPRKVAVVKAPRGSCDFRCVLSPAGDRIAWQVSRPAPRGSVRTEIWVVNVRGGKRRLGGVTRPDDGLFLRDLQWLPGGRRLSFILDDRLYTVPVDPTGLSQRFRP